LHTGDTVKQTLELPVPRHSHSWYAVVAVEQLPPKELISGDSQPLPAGQTSTQHGIMGQTQEDLQHQAVWQKCATLHNILCIEQTHTYTHRVWLQQTIIFIIYFYYLQIIVSVN
uniref:Uncharacterized protein n=1 Tax=Dicentrarchus labrax TaxID=13489 RepID=A0A8C4DIY0_DICLA